MGDLLIAERTVTTYLQFGGQPKHWRDAARLNQIERQGGTCALCPRKLTWPQGCCCVDHDHETGLIRGILCARCNSRMATIDGGEKWITDAINYRNHGGVWVPPPAARI